MDNSDSGVWLGRKGRQQLISSRRPISLPAIPYPDSLGNPIEARGTYPALDPNLPGAASGAAGRAGLVAERPSDRHRGGALQRAPEDAGPRRPYRPHDLVYLPPGGGADGLRHHPGVVRRP